jgi:hypothetical protein
VFSALNPEELKKCFVEWTRSVADLCKHEVIVIDGKSMCGSCVADIKAFCWGRRFMPGLRKYLSSICHCIFSTGLSESRSC